MPLIVFEGIDRSGKSTQAKILADAVGATLFRFPDRTTPVGRTIDACLRGSSMDDTALHLLFVANRYEVAPRIRALLDRGSTVIVDRYSYSGLAYSRAKGLDTEVLEPLEDGLPKADLIFYMSVSPEVASRRADYGDECYETIAFQTRVAKAFDIMREDSNWHMIEGNADVADVSEKIRRIYARV